MSGALLKYGLAALLAAAVIGGLYFKGRIDGVAIERARIAVEIEKARKERERVESDTRRLSDDELFDRLLPRR